MVVDSYCSGAAIAENLVRNDLAVDPVDVRHPHDDLSDLHGRVELLVVRPPRNLALLEHLLRCAAPTLATDAVVVGAEMVKHLHSSTLEVFERVLGATTTTRAHRRARLIECRPQQQVEPGRWDWPSSFTLQPGDLRVTSWPGVFSASRLDHGTALLLDHLPETDGDEHIVDLGCGNGVLGTVAALENPDADLTFVDDSALALESARSTYDTNLGPQRPARFVHGTGLFDPRAVEVGAVGLVLCNPPFHERRAASSGRSATATSPTTPSCTASSATARWWPAHPSSSCCEPDAADTPSRSSRPRAATTAVENVACSR